MNLLSFFRLTLTSLSGRLRRAHAGSVLFIVVVLLLLLGMISVAFVSSSRSDRVASAQNVMNCDVDVMLSGISKVCEGIIVDDLNDPSGNLQGLHPGPTQSIHSVYQGTFNINQAYNVGDIVSYPAPATIPPTPPSFYVATQSSTGSTPTASSTSWTPTTHVFGVTSSLIQPWLAERIPTPEGVTGTFAVVAYWPNISQMAVPVGGTSATSILGTPFESPDGMAMPPINPGATLSGQIGVSLVPGFRQITGGISVPTLKYPGLTNPMIAGDADGDGIADSLLFRIPGAGYDGLTWYAAVRIIDNNSAINLNTALSRDKEYTIAGGSLAQGPQNNYYCLFPTSVGLAELLHPGDMPANFANFNSYRVGATAATTPQADVQPGGANPLLPVMRPDFQFLNGGDLLNHQLIRRIANPGFSGNGNRCAALPLSDEAAMAYHFCLVNPETASSQVSSSLSENLLPFSLAYWTPPAGASPQYYRSTPFSDVNQWFNDNFNYDSTTTPDYGTEPQPVRSLLVTRNPVSNAITPVYDHNTTNSAEPVEPLGPLGAVSNPYSAPANTVPGMMLPYGTGPQNYVHFKGIWDQSQVSKYQFNDIVVGGDGHTYIFVNPPTVPLPADHTSAIWVNTPKLENLPPPSTGCPTGLSLYQYWQFQPWSKTPVKANVNTATFRELYRAFWSVMAGNPSNQTPFGSSAQQHQFRSPLRDPTNTNLTQLDPENTMLLRAALAAVNTLGLRDASQNVISRTVYLSAWIAPAAGGPATQQPVMARVYSNAPQPVISEVYASSFTGQDSPDTSQGPIDSKFQNPMGYVAVELYNPYSVPMVLKNWQLGLIDRSGAGYPQLTFVENPDANTPNGTKVSVIAPPNQPSNTFTLHALNDPRFNPVSGKFDLPPPLAGIIVIPAHGYALLENYNGSPNASHPGYVGDALGRPASAGFVLDDGTTLVQSGIWYGPGGQDKPNTCDVYVPGLQLVIAGALGSTMTTPPQGYNASPGGELVLLRPRRSDGTLTASGTSASGSGNPSPATNDPLNTFDEGRPAHPNLYDLVPVDSFDFTGLTLQTPDNPNGGTVWSYFRIKGDNPDTWFRQIYPGRYAVIDATKPREEGTEYHAVSAPPVQNPWNQKATPLFGQNVPTGNSTYTNHFPPIQICNAYSTTYSTAGGPNTVQDHWVNPTIYLTVPPLDSSSPQASISSSAKYPYGAFARNGDLLDIPFIGAYRISQVDPSVNSNPAEPTSFVELNSLPRDCSFADANYTFAADQNIENVGRFCPVHARPAPSGGWTPQNQHDSQDYYAWTSNLYSYLTVQSLPDAVLPSFDPNIYDVTSKHPFDDLSSSPAELLYKYGPSGTTTSPPTPPPAVVLTAEPTASDQTNQGNVGVEGLVNINTASWKVLSMLPMITINEDPGTAANGQPNYVVDNEKLAKVIVIWRKSHGPFMSIYDLNSVIDYANSPVGRTNGFQNAEGFLAIASGGGTGGVSSLNGLLSPPDPAFPTVTPGGTASGLSEDYQSDFAMLSRVSDLITTRSDTFTVYVEIQGWQNVGTDNVRPAITRHYAYVVDRSAITGDPSSRFPRTITVPSD